MKTNMLGEESSKELMRPRLVEAASSQLSEDLKATTRILPSSREAQQVLFGLLGLLGLFGIFGIFIYSGYYCLFRVVCVNVCSSFNRAFACTFACV